MMDKDEILHFTEFETKYRTDSEKRFLFKKIMEDDLGLKGSKFLYVQSGDEYFTLNLKNRVEDFLNNKVDKKIIDKLGNEFKTDIAILMQRFVEEELGLPKFLRHRASEDKKIKRKEITFKKKHKDANNIRRTEINLRVDNSNAETIKEFCEGIGYEHTFDVYKYCDIYFADDAVLVFYSVKDDHGKMDHFIEIEVNEEMDFTEDQAWTIIKKYEKILEPIGITSQKRLRLSLFEMYNKPRENK